MALGSQGLRNMDHGPERIEDPEFKKMLMMKVRQIELNSFLVAVIFTILSLVIPG